MIKSLFGNTSNSRRIFFKKKKREEFIRIKSIYINERLTAYNRKLLWETRSKAKELGYRYIWTRNGRIYCKADDMTK